MPSLHQTYDRRVTTTRLERTTAPDGRSLAFARWGDLDGAPVFSLHGTPDSRLRRHWDGSVYAAVGACVITYDRPGYGGSDRHRGRRVVDCAADVAAIADHLGVDRFAVTGRSGGGPHCLAVAARLKDRVTRAACVVGVAPFDAPGLAWLDGMDEANVREVGWALAGEGTLTRELERYAAAVLERLAVEPATAFADFDFSAADRAELARAELQAIDRESFPEAFRNGVFGWVDDDLALVSSWGFDITGIRVPTRIVYGTTDVAVPRAHGDWLARHVPGAEVIVEEGRGHFADPALVAERIGWLTAD
jgi:pimeloyl-ACP methyl ester carboxylesterase